MQPTYFPWAGYFNLIDQVDYFVFLDDVQFEKRSWQSRNRILLNGSPHWLSVSTLAASQDQMIHEIEVDDTQKWRTKHQRMLQQTYARHPFAKEIAPLIDLIGDATLNRLVDLNTRIIREICARLEIAGKLVLSSELNAAGKRSEKLIALCEILKCDEYLSPQGSAEYLTVDRFEENSRVRLSFQSFEPAEYRQPGVREFVSHLSIIDVIANLGFTKTREYVRRPR